jgi:hypothetical protein
MRKLKIRVDPNNPKRFIVYHLPTPKGWSVMPGLPVYRDHKGRVRAEVRMGQVRMTGPVPEIWKQYIEKE